MNKSMTRRLLSISVAAVLCSAGATLPAMAQSAPQASMAPQDIGPADAAQTTTVSIVLKMRHPQQLEAYARAVSDPVSPRYHHFLTTKQFVHQFAPNDQQVKRISDVLTRYGIQVSGVSASHLVLHATGTTAQFNAAFATKVHQYRHHGHVFHRPDHRPTAPATLADEVQVIAGLSNEALFHPMSHRATYPAGLKAPKVTLPKTGTIATNTPGSYTVGDVANMYNINPLYAKGITGKGQTVGIATLANFVPQDAYTYWSAINLDVKPNRITQVHVDGGGELSADAGSGETTLDVEQSGGIAPQADIIVYDAPNTDAGFIDVFATAVSENKVDTLSVSWGSPEAFYFDSPLTGGDYTGDLQAFHEIFLEAAVQGISVFAASGDSGAYDTNRALPYPQFTKTLTVDAPASDPLITAAGGTTTPLQLTLNGYPDVPPLVVSSEQAWSWRYIDDYLAKYLNPAYKDIDFSVGTGGGVSSYWRKPIYQYFTSGMRRTEPGQSLGQINPDGSVTTFLTLPAHFRGRNVPDISMDADPYSGFIEYSSLEGGFTTGNGGTSFVAPQLNGITALLAQRTHGRLGFVNPALYTFGWLYGHSERSPLRDITGGDNWFYKGVRGYEPATGLGAPDVGNLSDALAPFAIFRGHGDAGSHGNDHHGHDNGHHGHGNDHHDRGHH